MNSDQIDASFDLLNADENAYTHQSYSTGSSHITLEKLEIIEQSDNWFKVLNETRAYAQRNDIDLVNPYDQLLSNHENVHIRHELIKKIEISLLDGTDYAIAAGAGIIAGIVDAVFVGTIGSGGNVSPLQGWTDKQYASIVNRFGVHYRASDQINKLDRNKMGVKEYRAAKERILRSVKEKGLESNIKYLENRFRVLYDTTGGNNSKLANGLKVNGMNTGNHHMLSLGHDPGPLGLVFSIIDQLTGKATFIEDGRIIRAATENINRINGQEVKGIIDAAHNWFGHCLSDISGSGSTKIGNRGSGLPAPFYVLFQRCQFGSIPIDSKNTSGTIAQLTEKMFKEGYDTRAFTAQLIPIIVYEVIIRMFWFFKQHFYFGKIISESMPFGGNNDLQRMLFVAAASFSAIDVGHATVKAGGAEPITFFMTLNYPGLINFGFKAVQNLRNEVAHIKKLNEFDADIQAEWDRLIITGSI
ncbi:hypothetical protein LNN31_16335 [Acetobacterium wieringae]|uniref:Uncharacterized protein n=1 Tax=Acetobacterium wieringae TaxID=52694 RepID=A0ABY6HFL1_9FIRM|nr:hypothetical protein [Acetobacterium wieringae]UYO62338.1 hypothetical protein LNN31_16335 [Acetobacterium wieringae]